MYFAVHFVARFFHLKLNKVINREEDEKDFAEILQRTERGIFKKRESEKELHVWYEIVQCFRQKNLSCFQNPSKAREVRLGKMPSRGLKAPRDIECSK